LFRKTKPWYDHRAVAGFERSSWRKNLETAKPRRSATQRLRDKIDVMDVGAFDFLLNCRCPAGKASRRGCRRDPSSSTLAVEMEATPQPPLS
jgi:hypothetical protein